METVSETGGVRRLMVEVGSSIWTAGFTSSFTTSPSRGLASFPSGLGMGNGSWLLFPTSERLDSPAVIAWRRVKSRSPFSLLCVCVCVGVCVCVCVCVFERIIPSIIYMYTL